ncbi:MAG: hypothetical protein VR77_00945 [Flavobacteriales bacterium BRH_c54]|nr:MAG: hypothetical protein VR77_00945 [Flavobacteriales bacterium BRH_c54]
MNLKPNVYSSSQFNLNELPSDRRFEELVCRIFENRIIDDLTGQYDHVHLMPGVAEKGIDIHLKKSGKNEAAIQCKMKTSGNINKPEATKEILKFVLHYYQDKDLIHNLNTFKYYFVTSGKFASTTIKLLGDFNSEIFKETKLQEWVEEVIKSYVAFKNLNYAKIKKELEQILAILKVEPVNYNNINGWLNKYENTGIVNEFFSIKKVVDNSSIDKLIDSISPDIDKDAEILIKSYYLSAKNHLDVVKFIGHDISVGNRPRNITVSKLYVDPFFTVNKNIKTDDKLLEEFKNRKKRELRIHDVFKRSKHFVILGDPGSGKSLMVKNLILRFIKKSANIGGLKNYKNHIPFRIELRKYNEQRQKGNINIINYLASILKTEYQLNSVDEKILLHIIQNKSTLFFFDGLDEIFDIAQKNEVRDDILSFLSVNKSVKCIVTSRFIGYHDTQFPENSFYEFSIQDFNNKQIDKFIEKFYTSQIRNKNERTKEIESCKRQIGEIDNDLKSNPLILSLMSLLAINKVVIPDSRLDVYRSCTNTLVETRDKEEKQLDIELLVKNKRGTFGRLAFWQYNQTTNKKPVNQRLVIKDIAKYLVERKEFDDILEAEDASTHFMAYAERRSIYFDNNFTHKTFLEYYTASHIFTRYHNNYKKHTERDAIIENNIKNPAWHVVFELLIAMIDENLDESEIMDEIIEKQLIKDSIEIVYFFLSILKQTKNINDNTRAEIIENAIILTLDGKDIKQKKNRTYNGSNGFISLLNKLSLCSNHKNIIQTVLNKLEDKLDSDSKKVDFYVFLFELNHMIDRRQNKGNTFKAKKEEELIRVKDLNLLLFTNYYLKSFDQIDFQKFISEQIRLFGLKSINEEIPFKYHRGTSRVATFEIYINHKSTLNTYESIKKDLKFLTPLGIDVPFLQSATPSFWSYDYVSEHEPNKFKNLIDIMISNSNKLVSDFITYLLSTISISKIKLVAAEHKNNKKFIKMIDTITAIKKKTSANKV